MRKNLLALGISLLFLGMVFLSVSSVAIREKPEEEWAVVKDVNVAQPTWNLFVQGDLKEKDKFRVDFTARAQTPVLPELASVMVNLTDPNENTASYSLPVAEGEASYLEAVANQTGTYKANATGMGVSLYYLSIEKMSLKEKEPLHPYSILAPVGIAVFLGGVGVSLVGVKIPRRKRMRHQRRKLKHKPIQG